MTTKLQTGQHGSKSNHIQQIHRGTDYHSPLLRPAWALLRWVGGLPVPNRCSKILLCPDSSSTL